MKWEVPSSQQRCRNRCVCVGVKKVSSALRVCPFLTAEVWWMPSFTTAGPLILLFTSPSQGLWCKVYFYLSMKKEKKVQCYFKVVRSHFISASLFLSLFLLKHLMQTERSSDVLLVNLFLGGGTTVAGRQRWGGLVVHCRQFSSVWVSPTSL